MQNLIQISYIRFKSYEDFHSPDHNRLDNCSANPYLTKVGRFVCQWLGDVDMHMYAKSDKKIYHVVQGLWTFSLTGDGRTDG